VPILTIEIKYMALLYSHEGLTVLLPSSGHDASITKGGTTIPLKGAEVVLERDNAIVTGSSNVRVTNPKGLLFLDQLMAYAGKKANSAKVPRNELLTRSVDQLPELNARIALPDGTLNGDPTPNPVPYEFRSGGTVIEMSRSSAFYHIDLAVGARWTLRVLNTNIALDVSSGGTVVIANSDRPSANVMGEPWFEFRHLLDLIDLEEMKYVYPTLVLGTITPNENPCGSMVCGSVT